MTAKKYCTAMCLAALLLAAMPGTVPAAIVVSESFNYTLGADLNGQNGGTGWGAAWVAPTGQTYSAKLEVQDIAAPAGYPAATGNQALAHTATSATVRTERALLNPISTNPVANQVLYGSILFRRNDATNGAGTENSEFFRLDNASNIRVASVGQTSGELMTVQLGGSIVTTTTSVGIGTDYLLVLKLTLNPAGTSDVLEAELFTAADTLTEPGLWQGQVSLDLGDVATKLVVNQARLAEDLHFDEILLGQSFADVVPEPASMGLLLAGGLLCRSRRTDKR
ncbi:MAG: PEP-CTERM sorting domain-containing protein [Phycisphaeraceae bacterium]|nr:PEP-CTERM sorting domain-containing protein [Phycisphaeraceae bacterium]